MAKSEMSILASSEDWHVFLFSGGYVFLLDEMTQAKTSFARIMSDVKEDFWVREHLSTFTKQ